MIRGYNWLKGSDVPTFTWSPEVLKDLPRSGLLAYWEVAHFGRGRGEWSEPESPTIWIEHINQALDLY